MKDDTLAKLKQYLQEAQQQSPLLAVMRVHFWTREHPLLLLDVPTLDERGFEFVRSLLGDEAIEHLKRHSKGRVVAMPASIEIPVETRRMDTGEAFPYGGLAIYDLRRSPLEKFMFRSADGTIL